MKNGSVDEGDDCGWVDWLQGPGSAPPEPEPLTEALDGDLSFTTGGDRNWYRVGYGYYDSVTLWGAKDSVPKCAHTGNSAKVLSACVPNKSTMATIQVNFLSEREIQDNGNNTS